MDTQKLQDILTTFADPGTAVEISKGNLLVQINDKTLLARIRLVGGDVQIEDETGEAISATKWIISRVAKLHILAERILTFLPETPHFVHPEANLYDNLDDERPYENEHVADALSTSLDLLSRRFAFTTSVVYLTSDAGEGKTTLINEMARKQAQGYKDRKTDWLLVPIALGGRPFMRFDDVIAGYLTNKLRFPLFYYDAFIELVKLGVIIPAFDGFEETLVINASGDAYSAIGNLMSSLDQQGTVVISARKAFFEYQELKLQAKLYDSIGGNSVAFSRLQLHRWGKNQFIQYAQMRDHPTPELLYEAVTGALHTNNHALLTRAVLANQLLTVASSENSLTGLLTKLGSSPNDYFPVFVDTIIEREVLQKWLDSSGEAAQPLLTIQEHRELLSMIAQEMWLQATELLKIDILELLATLFCELKKKSAAITQQIQQRVKQHALLVPSDTSKNQFGFDHEEFRHYFLGLAIAKLISAPDGTNSSDISSIFRRSALPTAVLDSVVCGLKNSSTASISSTINTLKRIVALDSPTSYLHDNCAQLILRIANHKNLPAINLENLTLGSDALSGVSFSKIIFKSCTFHSTNLHSTVLKNCIFQECTFDRLDLATGSPEIHDCTIENCDFGSITPPGKDAAVYDPHAFRQILQSAGFITPPNPEISDQLNEDIVADDNFMLIQKLLKCFSNRTHITDLLIKTKFGKQASAVFDELIPQLIQSGILYKDTYRGGGKQDLFKLNISMLKIQEALEHSRGNSHTFLKLAETATPGSS